MSMHVRSRSTSPSSARVRKVSALRLAVAAASLTLFASASLGAVYATSVAGCLHAGYSGGKLVVAGSHTGEFRCIGATPTEQVMLDAVWSNTFTIDALTSINEFITVIPDFASTTHDSGGVTYTLISRLEAGDRFIDILALGVVAGAFGEVSTLGSMETTDLGINGSGDPAGGRYHAYDGIITDELCNADLAVPYGVYDFSDIVVFLTDFAAMEPTADLAPPMGVFDFSDVVAYLILFGAGCQ